MSGPDAPPSAARQQVLQLYLSSSGLDSFTIGWAFHDGTAGAGPGLPDRGDGPPYTTGVAALEDGWRLIQMSQLLPPPLGAEHTVSYLPNEFVFERMIHPQAGSQPTEE